MEKYFNFFPLLFIPLWLLIVGLISKIGGWNKLSELYPISNSPSLSGDTYRFQSIRIGMMTQYKSSINITICREGILLKPVIFFSFLHKPIYLPFNQFHDIKFSKILFMEIFEFAIADKRLQIYGKSIQEIKRLLNYQT